VLEYTHKRELVQILGTIEQQRGGLSMPLRGFQAKMAGFTGDIEKIIREKYAELTDTQKYYVTEITKIQRICA
jgi:hypothetical protein